MATRVNTEAETVTFAMKLLIVQYLEFNSMQSVQWREEYILTYTAPNGQSTRMLNGINEII